MYELARTVKSFVFITPISDREYWYGTGTIDTSWKEETQQKMDKEIIIVSNKRLLCISN